MPFKRKSQYQLTVLSVFLVILLLFLLLKLVYRCSNRILDKLYEV